MKPNKISVFFVINMLIITSISVVITNYDTLATPDPENISFDYELIYNVTNFLSKRITESYHFENGEIAKGRDFGSKGELAAAQYIADVMDDLDLIDLNYSALSYRQQIKDSQEKKHIPLLDDYEIKTNDSLEVNDRRLLLRNRITNQTIDIKDFYISPELGIAGCKKLSKYFDYNDLTKNINYTDLHILPFPIISWSFIDDFINNTLTQNYFNDIFEKLILNDENEFEDNLTSLFEQYYNFTFEDILENPENATNLPWYNDSLFNYQYNYTLIDEFPFFNPNLSSMPIFNGINDLRKLIYNTLWNYSHCIDFEVNELQPWITFLIKPFREKLITNLLYIYLQNFKAIILYDSSADSFNCANGNFAIPIIYINRTLGEELKKNSSNYTIDIQINQSWNDSVESYNVIGQINGSNPDPKQSIILECLYDSVWNQGAADSAIGVGMTLALAKYLKQLEGIGIKPKYNVTIALFGGEEHGCKGAFYYEMTLPDSDNINKTVIDLNQLGFIQTAPNLSLIMNVATNRILLKPVIKQITDITDYANRKNDGTEFKLSWTPLGSVSDEVAFARPLTNNPLKTKTIMFLKDFNWTRHHHDGENHTKGDTMEYYDPDDIALTMEMIWNVTRFFAMNPDSYFDDYHFDYTDSNNDEKEDTVNVSFTIKSVIPEDKITIRLMLIPKYVSNPLHPGYPILYRYRTEKEFIATPDGTDGFISLTLPKGAPSTSYRVQLVLLNSTGDTYVDLLGKDSDLSQSFDTLDDINDFFSDECDIDFETALIENSEEISSDFNMDIADFLERYPRLNDIRELIQDFAARCIFNDDNKTDFRQLSPPNNPPERPDLPIGPNFVNAHQEYEYTTKTTDPDDDPVEYKWRFQLGDLIFNYNKWSNQSDSGEYFTQKNSWDNHGWHFVTVKARDIWHSPNVQSGYSLFLPVYVSTHSWFDAPSEALRGEQVQFNGYLYGAEMNQIRWDMGSTKGWQNISEVNPNETFTTVNNYTITVNVTDEQDNEYLFSKDIEVKNMISGFTGTSGNTNQTLRFNDTSRLCEDYRVTNWTWDFDDGTIVYGECNVNHKFTIPGVYTVTLTVRDAHFNEYDICSQTYYIENDSPIVLDVTSEPVCAAPDQTIVMYADAVDSISGINNVTLNITLPDSSWQTVTMEPTVEADLNDSDYDYTVEFTDTDQVGVYYYSILVQDGAGNNVSYGGFSFTVSPFAFDAETPYYGARSSNNFPVSLVSSIDANRYYTFASLANDVVLWMPMDTLQGENPADISGYDNTGVCQGGANQTENGMFGNGFRFDGTDDYIEIESNISLLFNASQAMTWSFWVRPEYSTVNTTMGMVSKTSRATNGSGFSFCLNTTTDDASFVICTPDHGVLRYSECVDLNIGNTSWVHLTVVYNGSSGWDVYVNGSKKDTLIFPVISDMEVSYLLGAGRNATGDAADLFYHGMLDDVVLFRRGVDADEVTSLFNASDDPYAHNFTELPDGMYDFTGCAGYPGGFTNSTETRAVLIDTVAPLISNVSNSPETVGFGGVVQINATVMENGSGLLLVAVNITDPNGTSWNYSMACIGEDLYRLNFSGSWLVGQYDYSVWAMDNVGNTACDSGHGFNISADASMSIATLRGQ